MLSQVEILKSVDDGITPVVRPPSANSHTHSRCASNVVTTMRRYDWPRLCASFAAMNVSTLLTSRGDGGWLGPERSSYQIFHVGERFVLASDSSASDVTGSADSDGLDRWTGGGGSDMGGLIAQRWHGSAGSIRPRRM
mmetsp:Transcript_20803/g.59624  ORF Transcript_20803/g.59624 Transcript_20803/m.59624 type:complete len:138 (-) Transcript_20803:424-837(-)